MSTNSNRRKRQNNNRRRKKNNKGRRLNEEGNKAPRINPRFPNDVKMKPIQNRVIRYNCGAQTDFQVTGTQLLRLLFTAVNGTSLAVQLIGSIRIRRLSFYSVPSTNDFGNATSEIAFSWLGVLNAPGNLITDRGTSTVPACIKVSPPRESIAGMWFSSSSLNVTSAIFQFSCPANTVFDIDFDYIVSSGAATTFTMSSGVIVGTRLLVYSLSSTIVPDGGIDTLM